MKFVIVENDIPKVRSLPFALVNETGTHICRSLEKVQELLGESYFDLLTIPCNEEQRRTTTLIPYASGYAYAVEMIPPVILSDEVLIARITEAVQERLDTVPQERGYDGILSLCSYATSQDATFKAEGQAGVVWRDSCWRYCYNLLADYQQGNITQPTVDQVLAGLPNIQW